MGGGQTQARRKQDGLPGCQGPRPHPGRTFFASDLARAANDECVSLCLPAGKPTELLKITTLNGKTHDFDVQARELLVITISANIHRHLKTNMECV